ncbi:MAG: hypothetical protein ACE5PO_05285 [Candidatus Bathyarchaeia archaeon]
MTILLSEGDGIVGEWVVYAARKRPGERLIMKSETHRGIAGILYDARCWIEAPVKMKKD